jgi:hypothetical protein
MKNAAPFERHMTQAEQRYDWPLCYEAENLVLSRIDAFLARNSFAQKLAERMLKETGTLMLDWVDYLVVPAAEQKSWRDLGFVDDPSGEAPSGQRALWHPEAMLPPVLLDEAAGRKEWPSVLAIHPEHVADFIAAHDIGGEPEGEPLSRFRRILVHEENGTRFEAVERRGYRGFVPAAPKAGGLEALLKAEELWRTRKRNFIHDAEGFRHAHALLNRVVGLVGRDLACHVVFKGEREYWQSRNRAGQLQKARQDRLGLGWGNHDHHTFRCSRQHFVDLMWVLEKLGFERRERYYAGAQAGWGAQVLEHPVERIVTFCDVDLQPEETEIDFSRQPLPPSKNLGTIGLWVGLHGESLLQAGMHHLECRFDYELLREQLASHHVNTMKPFSDFPFLKQAFTEGERWPVRRDRAEKLLQDGLIDEKQFHQFTAEGAIGSHLENLQRKGGFKGFNQRSVSVIIQATDPRVQATHA